MSPVAWSKGSIDNPFSSHTDPELSSDLIVPLTQAWRSLHVNMPVVYVSSRVENKPPCV